MYEVELKVATEHPPVREQLKSLGADRQQRVEQADTYYDAPHRDFAETDEAIRIRSQQDMADGGTTTKITYKGPLVETESKTRKEYETVVRSRDAVEGILEGLGFSPAFTVNKKRTFYKVNEYKVMLDEVTDLGTFVEIETEAKDIEPAREGAISLLRDLGLDPTQQLRTSYLGLLLNTRE
jgi:adenylate cyclase class 2